MSKFVCKRWAVDISSLKPTLQQLSKAMAALQAEERLRLEKFHFMDDVLLSLVGRLLMRKFVANNAGLPYDEVRFMRDKHNKPHWLPSESSKHMQLSFSVSHHAYLVVLAGIAQSKTAEYDVGVGIDVMNATNNRTRPLAETFRLLRRQFTPSEWQQIRRADYDEARQLRAFMRHWTLKEAFTKELGVGITIDLQQVDFTIDANDKEPAYDSLPITSTKLQLKQTACTQYMFEEHLLHNDYCVAIAWRNAQPEPAKFELMQFEELLLDSDAAQNVATIAYCEGILQKQWKAKQEVEN